MKNQLLLASAALCVLITSCQKNNGSPEQTAASLKIKTITEDFTTKQGAHYSEIFTLSYDGQDRVTTMIPTNNLMSRILYDYPNTSQVVTKLIDKDSNYIHQTAYLNDFLTLDSTFQYSNDEDDSSSEKFTYNASKQLISKKDYSFYNGTRFLMNTTTYSYDPQGNLHKQQGNDETITNYYDSVIVTKPYTFYTLMSIPQHLPTRQYYESVYGNYTVTHTYTFDKRERLVSDKAASSTGEMIIISLAYFD